MTYKAYLHPRPDWSIFEWETFLKDENGKVWSSKSHHNFSSALRRLRKLQRHVRRLEKLNAA